MLEFDAHPNVARLPAPLLEAQDLSLETRGAPLLRQIDLRIRAGRRTVIMGPNGAGKSLLLRVLHGLIAPSRGQVTWQGRPLDRQARSAQAMVFQRPVLLRRSVLGNMRFALAAAGTPRAQRTGFAWQALAEAGLAGLAHRPARVLSGGEQQRLALARALAAEPELLLLDEPTANLDPTSTQAIEARVRAASDSGVSVVMVTHDPAQARRLGEDLIFVHAGQVVETGRAADVLLRPKSPLLAAWIAGDLIADRP